MAAQPIMEFKRGDQATYTFQVPISAYVPGSQLVFVAKPAIDNDPLNLKAVINKTFGDANIIGPTDSRYNALYATYNLTFQPADIVGVTFATGVTENDYIGGFEYIAPGQAPVSAPYNNQYIKVRIYGDV